jgi:hypothetical protein
MARLTTAFLFVLVCLIGLIQAANRTYGICSCFTPKYDASCCILARGTMVDNVCQTPDTGETVAAYEKCCAGSGGKSKCKYGYRDGWPNYPGQYNCTMYP